MVRKEHRKYTREFKLEAIRLAAKGVRPNWKYISNDRCWPHNDFYSSYQRMAVVHLDADMRARSS